MDFARVDFGQRARQKVGLLLVVALQHHTVARNDQGFKNLDQACGWDDATIGDGLDQINPALLLFLTSVPDGGLFTCLAHVDSFVFVQQKECRFSHARVQSSYARVRYAKRNVLFLSDEVLRGRRVAARSGLPSPPCQHGRSTRAPGYWDRARGHAGKTSQSSGASGSALAAESV